MFLNKLLIIICIGFSAWSLSGRVKAAEIGLDVEQSLNLTNSEQVEVVYKIQITNSSSNDLINSIDFFTPLDDYRIRYVSGADHAKHGHQIVLDFKDNPLKFNEQRNVLIYGMTFDLLKDNNNSKRLHIYNFGTGGFLNKYSTIVTYPIDWGKPYYVSRSMNVDEPGRLLTTQNKDLDIYWGDGMTLSYNFGFSINGSRSGYIIPTFNDTCSQSILINQYENVDHVIFDDQNNAYLEIPSAKTVTLSGVVNKRFTPDTCSNYETDKLIEKIEVNFPKLESLDSRSKVKEIANYLKGEYEFSQKIDIHESFDTFKGDGSNLTLLALAWFRAESIPSYINIGWDPSLNGSNDYVYWVTWFDSENWNQIDITQYLTDNTDLIDKVNPQRIELFNLYKLDDSSVDLYERLSQVHLMPLFNVTQWKDTNPSNIVTSLNMQTTEGEKNETVGSLNILNSSSKIAQIQEITLNGNRMEIFETRWREGLLPKQYKQMEFEYFQTLKDILTGNKDLNIDISYKLGTQLIKYNQTQAIGVYRIGNIALLLLCNIGLTILFYILVSIIVFKLDSLKTLRYNIIKGIKLTAHDKSTQNI